MKSFHSLLFLCLLITQLGFSQSFLSGGIINQQDTTYGLIAINNNTQNASNCNFKKSESSELSVYTPDNIDGYFLENSKHYVSKNVIIDDAPRTIFLEYLLNGIVDLYYFNQKSGSLYFLEDEEGIHVLTSTQKEVFVDGIKRIQSAEEYKGSLKYLLKDTPELIEKIDQTSFSAKSLIDLTTKYHNAVCDEYACIDYTKVKSIDYEFNPYVSMNAMVFSTARSEGTILSLAPKFGIRFSFGDNDSGRPWKISTTFEIYKHKLDGEVMAPSPTSSVAIVPYILKADFMNYKLLLGANYFFNRPIKGFFINTNLFANYMVASNSEIYYWQPSINEYLEKNSDFNGFMFGVNLGLGYRIPLENKNAIDIRIENAIATNADNKQEAMYSTKQTVETSVCIGYVFIK